MCHQNPELNQIYIAENEQGGGFRLTAWEFEDEQLELNFASEVKSQLHCIAMANFTNPTVAHLVVVEPHMIKYWKI